MKNLFKDSAKWLTFSALVVITSPIQANALTINSALGDRNAYSMADTASGNVAQSLTPGTAAPFTYSGTTWNQLGFSGNNLLDSDGNTTTVDYVLSQYKSDVNDHGGSGILNLLGAGVHSDGPSTTGGFHPDQSTLPNLTLTGLDDNLTYSLAIISGGNYNNTNEWNIGGSATFSSPTTPTGFIGGTTLTTVSDTSQRSAWVEGVNYVQFTGLSSVGGSLTVQNRALKDKFSMNGFQLQADTKPVPAPLPLLGVGAAFHFSRKLRKISQGSTNSVSSTYSL
jgi:hypothetical protein